MSQSDTSLVLNDVPVYASEFSWNVKDLPCRGLIWLEKELKIGSCELKWILTLTCINKDYVNVIFHVENSGTHRGILTFKIKEFDCPETKIIELSKNCNKPSLERVQWSDLFRGGQIFSGRVSILNCDCIQKPNRKSMFESIIQLQKDIHVARKDKLYADIDIKVGKACFPAHKFILRARSPVFAKMLEHDMRESQDNCVTVEDTDETTIENFISFLYGGSLEDDSFDTVIGLYSLADKYEVNSLRDICRNLLVSSISESTVLEILKTSDLHTDEELKQKATQFISGQFSKIAVSPEWSSLIDNNARLASHVLRYVSVKCSSS